METWSFVAIAISPILGILSAMGTIAYMGGSTTAKVDLLAASNTAEHKEIKQSIRDSFAEVITRLNRMDERITQHDGQIGRLQGQIETHERMWDRAAKKEI